MDVKPKEFCLFVLEGDLFKHTNRNSAAMHINPAGASPTRCNSAQYVCAGEAAEFGLVWFGCKTVTLKEDRQKETRTFHKCQTNKASMYITKPRKINIKKT